MTSDQWQAIDVNERGSLTAVSSSDDKTIIRLVADPVTGALLVTGVSSGGGTGTWYDVTGTINSSNVTFTIPVKVKSDFLLVLGRQPQALSTGSNTYDYTYSAGATTTTITYTTAPDTSLSGQPHQAFVIS